MEMLKVLTYLLMLVLPLRAAVTKRNDSSCSPTEFSCGDGGCVSVDTVCDGTKDCADGGDELYCGIAGMSLSLEEPLLHRSRRQSACRKDQWSCRDGSCIPFDGKCDGIVDCPDSSDETHPLCRKDVCQRNWFRCTYGACVDGTAPCNGIKDCADNSDELLPKCRNETEEVRGQFKCADGSTIPAANHCDGVRDCIDGSDETVRTCAAKTCPSYLFQCAYGACVDSGSNCNQIQECADGSDEAAELCDKILSPTTPVKQPQRGNCMLPPYPAHGTYITNIPNAKPGDTYDFVTINITCRNGYGVEGSKSIYCYNGWWPEQMPKCVSLCHLAPHPSVEYRCLVSGDVDGSRACNEYEPTGTVVSPICRSPNYYSATALKFMRCIDGNWDYIARCSPGLTKNGTNITILIKDSVEVHVSDIQYAVPFNTSDNYVTVPNNNFVPVIPITDTDANKYGEGYNNVQSNNSNDKLPVVPITDSDYNKNEHTEINTVTNKPHDDSNTIYDSHKDNDKIDDSDYEIDDIDWRMGVPTNTNNVAFNNENKANNTMYSSENKKTENKTNPNKKYSTRSNNTNIYFNITNSSVHIYADDATIRN